MSPDPLAAAGGVPWRRDDGELRLAVVHRPRYDDWSFPKGTLLPGELPLLAAVREVTEETGLAVVVGRRLPRTSYLSSEGPKTVEYWGMHATGEFIANAETDGMEWLTPAESVQRLSYPDDRALVGDLLAVPIEPVGLLLIRHGQAGDSERWPGADIERPLDERGSAEAHALAEVLPVFGPARILSADPVRCRQTVQPLATRLGIPVAAAPEFGEDDYFGASDIARASVIDWLTADLVTAVSSQGGVIPDLLEWLFEAAPRITGVSPRRVDPSPPARKGSVWAMTAHVGRVISADYYATFLP